MVGTPASGLSSKINKFRSENAKLRNYQRSSSKLGFWRPFKAHWLRTRTGGETSINYLHSRTEGRFIKLFPQRIDARHGVVAHLWHRGDLWWWRCRGRWWGCFFAAATSAAIYNVQNIVMSTPEVLLMVMHGNGTGTGTGNGFRINGSYWTEMFTLVQDSYQTHCLLLYQSRFLSCAMWKKDAQKTHKGRIWDTVPNQFYIAEGKKWFVF